jgi:oxalate decarboxylase
MSETSSITNFPFKNNVPDPLLSGKELPTFKFALEKSKGKVMGGSFGKEATVEQLPISKGISGVSMRMEPGVTRELHWHATAAEWAFVLEGRVRTTTLDPLGRSEINDFDPGDIWYFPRGYPHSLACLGNEPCHFILIFDNGYFSEFGTFSITDWLGHASKKLLAKNFGQPETTFDGFPTEEAYFVRGRVPPQDASPIQGALNSSPETHKYRLLAQEPHSIHKFGREWRIGANRFPVSQTITGVILDLDPGGLRELHWHPNADEWQYYIKGKGRMTLFFNKAAARTADFNPGDVGYAPRTFGHYVENTGDEDLVFLEMFRSPVYQDFSLNEWITHLPPELVTQHLGISTQTLDMIPRSNFAILPA